MYASSHGMYQYIDWGRLDLDIVAPHLYYATASNTENSMLQTIQGLKRFGKPVYSSEFGCETYVGASKYGGDGWRQYTNQTISEEEQAENIRQNLEIFQKAQISGAYLYDFRDYGAERWPSFEIVTGRRNGPYSRRLGFYMYKSYVLSSSSAPAKSEFERNATIPSVRPAFNWLTGATLSLMQIQTTARNNEKKAWAR